MTMIDGYLVELDQTITTRLTCVIALIDAYTRRPPIGVVTFMLGEHRLKARTTSDNFYSFLQLDGKEVDIQIQTEYYAPITTGKIVLPRDEPRKPIAITLQPMSAYPFPSGTTLIRGIVRNAMEEVVSGAHIEIEGRNEWIHTTEKGEFVLYFNRLDKDDLLLDEQKPEKQKNKDFLKGAVGPKISIKAMCDAQSGTADLEYVEIGKTTSLKSPIELTENV